MRAVHDAWMAWVRTLYPGYFASVMATGIVSVALLLSHVLALSVALWIIGCVLLVFLALVYALRMVRFAGAFRRDFTDASTVFGFFTFIAAVGVIATRFSLANWTAVPAILTGIAAVTWFILTYWVFAMLLFSNEKPIERALNGSWLIAIVATESLAITWVLLTYIQPNQRATLQLMAYAYWTFGVLLYLIFVALIMYRFFFLRVEPGDLTPPYWINMGAMAITTVAGVRLLEVPNPSAFLVTLHPYIEGFTVMMWAWGTWWIPLLLIIGIWKYGISHEPIRYHPALWSIVFPLGMYATAIQLLAHIRGLEFIGIVGPACAWIAFAAWVLVALGWLGSTVQGIRRALATQPSRTAAGTEPATTALAPGTMSNRAAEAATDMADDTADKHKTRAH